MKQLSKLIFVFLVLSSQNSWASVDYKFRYFDLRPLYNEPLAYPRTPDTGVSINTSTYRGQRIKYLEASVGKNIPLITFDTDIDFTLQFGLSGGFWATLGYRDGAFPLLTEDFLMAVPLEFRYKNFSGAIKFNHISAHLGDGFEGLLEDHKNLSEAENMLEDLSGNKDVGILLKKPFSYSRDFMSIHSSYEYRIGVLDSRTYFHAGYVHKMIPDRLGRRFVGTGTEFKYPSKIFTPYYAQDFTWNEDTDYIDLSAELGIIMLSSQTRYYTMRLAFKGFMGKDRRGQLIGNDLKQFGFALTFY